MVPASAWQAFYRIPWLRENWRAVRTLREMFYVLMALYRADRLQEFARLRYLFFKMVDSFAQYGRVDAKDTVDRILEVPWFRENRRDVYRLISSYNRVVPKVIQGDAYHPSIAVQAEINSDVEHFFDAFKSLVHFDEKDERRVNRLVQNSEALDQVLEGFHKTLGY